ncbi:right-handed parallel beta-helix repeat-containing protein [Kitasatospora sp. NPDC057904]|uniref:right-handed parallel beta-helix repeat-containing protein n=1 Tax=Kitasatospora sp. NPDC057904 TaxID=3346275 RepID=UPI0036DF3B05
MSIRRHIGIAAALVSSAIAGTTLSVGAAHADATTLYVNNSPTAHCSDAGTGAQAQPYCTVQAAADAAQPGQTVQIAEGAGTYAEQVTVTHSGTPGHPITFQGLPDTDKLPTAQVGVVGGHGFSLSKVHDVTIQGLAFNTAQEAVLVADSDRIVVDGNTLLGAGSAKAAGIRLTGATTASTVSRNRIGASGGAGIAVDPGVTGTVVTTNALTSNIGGGIVVTDAPGTVVTSNTVAENCGTGVSLTGASSGAVIENNIITATGPTTIRCPQAGPVEFVVSAGSVTGTKADYNVVHPGTGVNAGSQAYSWAGTVYTSPAAFTAATGQGAHDVDTDPGFNLGGNSNDDVTPQRDTNALDSADAGAPGELTTDLLGNQRVDDPLVDNTGTGTATYYDRGAIERQNPFAVGLSWDWNNRIPAGHPLDKAFLGIVYSPWSKATATIDFGDGTGPQPFTPSQVVHTYPGPGTYRAVLSATDGLGNTKTSTTNITVDPVGPLSAPTISAVQNSNYGPTHVELYATVTSPWPLVSTTVDFGDGSGTVVRNGSANGIPHEYPHVGTYTATATFVDDHGRSLTYSQQVRVDGWTRSGTPVTGRWDGRASTHVGVFYSGMWSLATTNDNSGRVNTVYFGQSGDVPVTGSWDGGHDQLGIYRDGVFALRHDDTSVTTVSFGAPGDVPVPALWDGNGHAQLAVYRPSTNTFAVRHDDGSVSTATLGQQGDLPIVGDWDGVGHAQLGIARPDRQWGGTNTFALRHDDGTITTATYGAVGDFPVTGDWQGRGRTTFGIYRPQAATFSLSNAYAGVSDSVFAIITTF